MANANNQRLRIYMTGVGGQGTLTATNLLARVALEMGLEVTAGEIHGMAQRGGVVESTVLIGGWQSPVISHGEADILLGFEPMETLRGLPYLAPKGIVFSSLDSTPSPGVSAGREKYPDLGMIQEKVKAVASRSWFMHCREMGREAGSLQSGNISLLAAMCASGVTPFTADALRDGIRKFMAPKLVDSNLKAVDLGIAAI
ncbi:indolepyruvate oxidoreductase subunit beta [Desulfovibrio sp. OttesenSCG-928-C06]|nr:indolepyruvate oxidoreductase subunit beta [Desulfovibrio sp. OttesenSCG-928-C06]